MLHLFHALALIVSGHDEQTATCIAFISSQIGIVLLSISAIGHIKRAFSRQRNGDLTLGTELSLCFVFSSGLSIVGSISSAHASAAILSVTKVEGLCLAVGLGILTYFFINANVFKFIIAARGWFGIGRIVAEFYFLEMILPVILYGSLLILWSYNYLLHHEIY